MDIYAYRGEWYCPDCASSIMKGLGRHADSGDSNDYPQCAGPADQVETDCPEHCSGCEEFLKTALTETGRQYVKEQLLCYVFNGHGREEILQQWADYYNVDWPPPEDIEGARGFGTQCANEALAMMGYPEDEESLPEGPQPGDWEALKSKLVGRGPTYDEGRAFVEGFKAVIEDHLENFHHHKEYLSEGYAHSTQKEESEILEEGTHATLLVKTFDDGLEVYDIQIRDLIIHLECDSEQEARKLHEALDWNTVDVEKSN